MSIASAAEVMDLTPADLDAAASMSQEKAQAMLDSIVFWGEETPALLQHLTPAQWARVVAERKRIGRPLDVAEVEALNAAA